jgi:small subunit ribosomal protein S18
MFCGDKSAKIDYKAANHLQSFISERGKILPRRATGTCARHQREMAVAIKRARHLALLPYTVERYKG